VSRIRLIALVATLTLSFAGCSSSTAVISDRMTGTWSENGLVRGAVFTFTINSTGPTLAGTGNYGLEAGRGGTTTVTGSVASNDSVHVTFTYDYGATAHFDGIFSDENTLSGNYGQINSDGPAASPNPVTFSRR
jgi:hypothetical protein